MGVGGSFLKMKLRSAVHLSKYKSMMLPSSKLDIFVLHHQPQIQTSLTSYQPTAQRLLLPTESIFSPIKHESSINMVSLKATLLTITVSLAGFTSAVPAPAAVPAPEPAPVADAAPAPQSTIPFHPPGKKCWTSADCYRAYFCAGAANGKQGMCTYG